MRSAVVWASFGSVRTLEGCISVSFLCLGEEKRGLLLKLQLGLPEGPPNRYAGVHIAVSGVTA